MRQASLVASDVVWWPAGPGASHGSVAALTVSYNTRELTAFLLWSLRTIVSWPELEIVVVDNGSGDGSAQLLAEAGRGGSARCSPITATVITAPGSTRESPTWPRGPGHDRS
jgi:GT2 family glycosyltransferase